MTNALKQTAQAALDSPKVGAVVSGATMTSGWGSKYLAFIPGTVAEVAACLGGLLSVVLIVKHGWLFVKELRERNQRIELNEIKLQERRKGNNGQI